MKYELMHRTKPAAVIEIKEDSGHISKIESVLEPGHMPVGVIDEKGKNDCNSLDEWWNDRSIPIYRPRVIKLLNFFDVIAPYKFLPRCYGLSLSDQYWIRPVGSDLEWEKINFFENSFSEDAGHILLGLKEHDVKFPLNSPDYTTNGNLEKCWKIINGRRYLVKGGECQEPFNEVVASKLMDQMDIPHVPYTLTEINGNSSNEKNVTVSQNSVSNSAAVNEMMSKLLLSIDPDMLNQAGGFMKMIIKDSKE